MSGAHAGLVAAVSARIARGLPVRRTLAPGGRVHIDRPLPFLCVYRRPPRPDPGTAALVRTQASYLVSPEAPVDTELESLVGGLAEALAAASGRCLVLELWTAREPGATHARVVCDDPRLSAVSAKLAAELGRVRALTLAPEIVTATPAPTGHAPLVAKGHARCMALGLELAPRWRDGEALYPLLLRELARELGGALMATFFKLFDDLAAPTKPRHYHELGRRRVVAAVHEVDQGLVAIERAFDFLLSVTPVNSEEAWSEVKEHARAPALAHRPLTVDPEREKRRLYALPIERIEDPVLAALFRDKRRELECQLGMLEDLGTPRFLYGSLQLYGAVEPKLLVAAERILAEVAPATSTLDGDEGGTIDAPTFARHAEALLGRYRADEPTLGARVELRDDVVSLIVSRGDLLVPRRLAIAPTRLAALLAHEVGTHIVTQVNGRAQPLGLLGAGLAGYEATQEGLAMFAEHVVGGLDVSRLRLIASRVVAVQRVVEQVPFNEVVSELVAAHHLSPRAAFGVALRVFRGGGLTKDAIYLRGLIQVLEYLAAGGALESLLIGKIALAHVPMIEELLRRGVLVRARVRPHWLDGDDAEARITRSRSGLDVLELVTPKRKAA